MIIKNKFYKALTPKLLIVMLSLDALMFLMLGFMLSSYILINNQLIIAKIPDEYLNSYLLLTVFIITICIHFLFSYIFFKKIM